MTSNFETRPGPCEGNAGPGRPATPVLLSAPRVIGIDLSLTATGIADSAGTALRTHTIHSTPSGRTVSAQRDRLRHIVTEIADHISTQGRHPALVLIEGPSYGSRGAGTWDRGGLWWLTVDQILGRGIDARRHPLAVVPPAVLKKYAAGRGNATKADMRVALNNRAGLDIRDDDQVDAWFLCAMGLDYLGHPPVELPKTHRVALDKVAWPAIRGVA